MTDQVPSQEATNPNDQRPQRPQANRRPSGGGSSQLRPLTPAELENIMATLQRVPGLGRIVKDLISNRDARIHVPETALGKEFFEIVSQYDRLAGRSGMLLTRSLTPENHAIKSTFELRALELMEPMARLAAELAVQFDHPTNPIARHSRIKAIVAELKEAKEPKAPAEAS